MEKKGKRKPLTEAERDLREAAKVAAFKKLAAPRVRRAKKAIELIGNLAAPGYRYTPEQVETIRDLLTEYVAQAMSRFQKKSKDADEIVI